MQQNVTRTQKYGPDSPYAHQNDPDRVRRPLVRDLDNMLGLSTYNEWQRRLLVKWRAEAASLEGEPKPNPGGRAMPRVVAGQMSPQEMEEYVSGQVARAMAAQQGHVSAGPAGRPGSGPPPQHMEAARARMAAEAAAERAYLEQTQGPQSAAQEAESWERPAADVAAEHAASRAPQAGAPQPPPKPRPEAAQEQPEAKGATVSKAKS